MSLEFRELLRRSRAQTVGSNGLTVLDVLQGAMANDMDLERLLLDQAGVAVLTSDAGLSPDFSRWNSQSAMQFRCVVLRNDAGRLLIAASDPWDEAVLRRVGRAVGEEVDVLAVSGKVLATWLSAAAPRQDVATELEAVAQGPVVELVDRALREGYRTGASDVHFECDRYGLNVKHRLDGVLTPFGELRGVQQAQEAISRIKVLAKLDITERRLPQDGRFRFQGDDAEVDMRVSIMPSVHGEDAVIRLLDKAQLRGKDEVVSLDLLGFEAEAAQRIRELSSMPSGMVLVTGPTGSGKTTTLYAALSEINSGFEKIITIEDPVEYELPGVLQIPVNERKGLTFAKGLRSILRHDPDRILVGEIRDAETAEIAVQSALTGHLVFTTVHANNVPDIVGRFRHFGLDMFGFMSALNGVVVQRLLRRLCSLCGADRPATDAEQQWLQKVGCDGVKHLRAGAGCAACHGTGYSGRFVVAEVQVVDDVFRDHVTGGAPLSVVKQHIANQGGASLLAQALRCIRQGSTTVEEVKRVIGNG